MRLKGPSFIFTVISVALYAVDAQGGPCGGTTHGLTVSKDGGTVYSSGYPDHYYNSDNCSWLLSTLSSSQIVQVETLDIDVEQDINTCVDFIAAYDGESDQSPLLRKWCGREKAVVQSTGQALYLQFVTNPMVVHKGFAIRYHAITPYDLTCEEGPAKALSVGPSPVHYHFVFHETRVSLCDWLFEGQDSQYLSLTFVDSSGFVRCSKGFLALYHGMNTSTPEVVRWCDSMSAPFSSFHSRGPVLMRIFFFAKPEQDFELGLKVQTRLAQEVCDVNQMPVFEMEKGNAPLIMALPYAITAGGTICPVQFHGRDSDAFRIDVLKENGRNASCNSTAVEVYKSQGINVSMSVNFECWRGMHPVFLPYSPLSTVRSNPGNTSIIRVITTDYTCSGHILEEMTFRNIIRTQMVPGKLFGHSGDQYSNNCIFRMLLIAMEDGDHPRAEFERGTVDHRGSYILRVYDGSSITDQVIFERNETSLAPGEGIVGPKREMLVEFTSIRKMWKGYIKMKYSSVPEVHICQEEVVKLTATPVHQTLSSVNYPNYYPIDYRCKYVIKAEAEGHVVHLKALADDFGFHCADRLDIYDGSSDSLVSNKIGMICKGNPEQQNKFESHGDTMTVAFTSDESGSNNAWRLQYYSGPPSGSDAQDPGVIRSIIIGVVLGIIIVLLVIAIICIVVRGWQSDRAQM